MRSINIPGEVAERVQRFADEQSINFTSAATLVLNQGLRAFGGIYGDSPSHYWTYGAGPGQ